MIMLYLFTSPRGLTCSIY
uniref:Uncharacterized protein n=1 Tax=Arundo donax TaxID=35708 RepID=A0A0A8YUF6_ARUDO